MTTTKTTLRGHCPCCGNLQAVPRGISKHGYTVANGWFQGVCIGEGEQPVELSRARADKVIADVRAQCVELDQQAAELENGTRQLFGVEKSIYNRDTRKNDKVFVKWADLSDYDQKVAIANAVSNTKYRARTGRDFADYLEGVVEQYHGKPLIEEVKAEPAPRIKRGDRKLYDGRLILEAYYTQGARVYYNGGKGWIGTQAWRRLPDAA